MGENGKKQWQTYFGGFQNHCRWWCSHEIKRGLLFGRKAMTNLDGILKSRDMTLPTKVCIVKAMVFPVVMYGCESWTIKKTKHWRIDAFELWRWRRLLESPLDSKEIQPVHPKENQPWVLIGSTDAEAETQYFVHLMQRADILEKNPAGKDWRQRRRGWQNEMVGWHHWLNGHEFE